MQNLAFEAHVNPQTLAQTLADCGATPAMCAALSKVGVTAPSRVQALAFRALSEGKHGVVADQTGSGKTLAYLAPLLQRVAEAKEEDPSKGGPRLLVLAPTAELAEQVHTVARALCEVYDGPRRLRGMLVTSSTGSLGHAAAALRRGDVDVVVATPGRALALLKENAGKPPALDLSRSPSIVLDEVDVLFLDDSFGLQPIGEAAAADSQFVFVTATLPTEVIKTVTREFPGVEVLKGPGLHRAAPGVRKVLLDCSLEGRGRGNSPGAIETALEKKLDGLRSALEARPLRRTMVFCNTLENCRRVENALLRSDRRQMKWRVLPYHSGLKPEAAQKSLQTFSAVNSLVPLVLVCTDRASRGMDFGITGRAGGTVDAATAGGVDHVILFDFPRDVAEWVRRVGRTGRAGRGGLVTILAQGKQVPLARELIAKTGKGERLYDLPGEGQDRSDGQPMGEGEGERRQRRPRRGNKANTPAARKRRMKGRK
mmetsp:Transcript_18440/g.56346  ORF Transcript_18440/g.56346 Transcript_18440/m.56346 type:complete len:484 (-) Transcript_18440:262-1713(-)